MLLLLGLLARHLFCVPVVARRVLYLTVCGLLTVTSTQTDHTARWFLEMQPHRASTVPALTPLAAAPQSSTSYRTCHSKAVQYCQNWLACQRRASQIMCNNSIIHM